jgi:hypothetical protein
MPSQEDISNQQERLATYRHRLALHLNQQALHGKANVPASIGAGIREARDNIQRIKAILRGWCVAVEDHPDDEDPDRPRRARIFISYKRDVEPDQPVALAVFRALSQHHDVFIDQTMIVGADWPERVKAELCRADYMIVLLSPHAVGSQMVEQEVATAHHLARSQGGPPAILPVRLAYRAPFQYPLSEYLNHLNWATWESTQDTARLIEELGRAVAGEHLQISTDEAKAQFLQASAQSVPPQPMPSAQPHSLDLPEGTMDLESTFYVERACDPAALETIQRQGVTITIKGPRQMGKSSLLIRTIDAALKAGKRVAYLDFQLFDRAALDDADRFFRQFCAWLTDELEMDDRLDEYWNTPLGNSQRCTRYVGRYLLKELDDPLVLAMDEVESIFEAGFRSDFFGMLRSWHNSRATTAIWKRLDLALVTSTEPYQLIANLNQSPFNVGQVLELEDFTPEQVADLNRRHGAPLTPDEERQLIDLLGGHPFLIRRALYHVAVGRGTATDLLRDSTDDRGPFGDHLRYHLFRLHDKPELVHGLLQAIRHNTSPNETIFFRLRGAGLVRRTGRAVLPRCRLYAHYFRERLTR